jgi:hypothetical protein
MKALVAATVEYTPPWLYIACFIDAALVSTL